MNKAASYTFEYTSSIDNTNSPIERTVAVYSSDTTIVNFASASDCVYYLDDYTARINFDGFEHAIADKDKERISAVIIDSAQKEPIRLEYSDDVYSLPESKKSR